MRRISPMGARPAKRFDPAVAASDLEMFTMASRRFFTRSYVDAASSYTSARGVAPCGFSGCASKRIAASASRPALSSAASVCPLIARKFSFESGPPPPGPPTRWLTPIDFSCSNAHVACKSATSPSRSAPSPARKMTLSHFFITASYFSRIFRLRKKIAWCRSLSPTSTQPRSSTARAAAR